MSRAANSRDIARGAQLLLAHCSVLADAGEPRAPGIDRLRLVLGPELTRFLVCALAGGHRTRSRGLAA